MYRIPPSLDLSAVVGQATSQVCVGQFDVQFRFGAVSFTVESPIRLFRGGRQVAHWTPAQWPEAGFRDILNQNVARCDIVGDRRIVIRFEDGLEMWLEDSSDQYESMQIHFAGNRAPIII